MKIAPKPSGTLAAIVLKHYDCAALLQNQSGIWHKFMVTMTFAPKPANAVGLWKPTAAFGGVGGRPLHSCDDSLPGWQVWVCLARGHGMERDLNLSCQLSPPAARKSSVL